LRFAPRPLPAHALIHEPFERPIARLDLAERGRILHTPIKREKFELIKLFSLGPEEAIVVHFTNRYAAFSGHKAHARCKRKLITAISIGIRLFQD